MPSFQKVVRGRECPGKFGRGRRGGEGSASLLKKIEEKERKVALP